MAQGPSEAEEEAPEYSWPVEVEIDRVLVVIYQPQPETLEGNLLEGRFAVSAEPLDGSEEANFGTAWFQARIDTDRDERTVTYRDFEVVRVHLPDVSPEDAAEGARRLTDWMEGAVIEGSMDHLLTTLELENMPDRSVTGLNHEPPEIHYRNSPAVLVMIDGDPILQPLEDGDLMAVVNTSFAILYDLSQTRYYLFAGEDLWYWARDIEGPWTFTTAVPSNISGVIPPPGDEAREAMSMAPETTPAEPGEPPEIVVVTVPSELIATVGDAEFTPISGTELMFVGNTDSDVFFHSPTRRFYVLLSGRWFVADQLEGPWTWVPSPELPETFQNIPSDSEIGSILAHVAGTVEAEEAVLDTYIPQTANIDRTDQSLTVEYDGDPEWEEIEGTTLSYAINTGVPVVRAEPRFYAVSDGVWYVADSAEGPWTVATAVPEEIYDIPASCPIHHVTYVEIFEATPEYVVTGYYPGYTGTVVNQTTVVHHTTVVYGTGWWYAPWWRTRYYPHHATWGFHVRWNPWTGWNMGFTWTNGWFTFGIGYSPWRPWCCYRGWWGPTPYRRGFYAGRRAGWHAGYRAGFRAGYRAGQSNIYRTQQARTRNATAAQVARNRPATGPNRPQARPSNRPNNVQADRSGNVYRQRPSGGWEQRTPGGGWGQPSQRPSTGQRPQAQPARPGQPQAQPARPQQRPSYPQTQQARPQTRPSQPSTGGSRPSTGSSLDRAQGQRDRGAARAQQHRQSRPSGAGARRGGRRGF
jgi:hypothetical protein